MTQRISFSVAELDKIIDGRYNSFRQAIGDSQYTLASPRALAADTEYLLTNDTLLINSVTAPSYITSRYDAVTNKIAFPEELDSPTYINDMQFTFNPTVAAAGTITVTLYVDESGTRDFTSDPAIRTYRSSYKATPEIVSILGSWYLGTDLGYDAKNAGVYATISASGAGDFYGFFESIYRN